MGMKTYRAFGSVLSLAVSVNDRRVNVSFSPVSNYEAGRGGSIYETDNEAIQEALESRRDYGTLFVQVTNDGWKDMNGDTQDGNPEVADAANGEEKQENLKVVNVSCLEDAKIWLAENLNWKPKARPTKAIVQKVAASFGYCFEGL